MRHIAIQIQYTNSFSLQIITHDQSLTTQRMRLMISERAAACSMCCVRRRVIVFCLLRPPSSSSVNVDELLRN